MTRFQKAKVALLKARKEWSAWKASNPDMDNLDADVLTELKRLTHNLEVADAEYGVAQAEMNLEQAAPDAHPLAGQCSMYRIIEALHRGDGLVGAEREMYADLEVPEHGPEGGLHIPWQMLEPLAADTATSAPAKSQVNLVNIVGRIFAPSVAARLGVNFQDAGMGSVSYIVISAGASPENKDGVTIKDSEAATVALTSLDPVRKTAAYSLRSIDLKRVPNWENALRADLTMAMQDSMDSDALKGSGAAPNPSGFVTALTNPTDPDDIAEFAAYIKGLADTVDGKLAQTMKQVRLAVPTGVFTHAASVLASNTAVTALEWMQNQADAIIATANLANNDVSQCVAYRTGDSASSVVAPVWMPEMIVDPYSGANKGLRRITMLWHWNFKILRQDAHKLVEYKVA